MIPRRGLLCRFTVAITFLGSTSALAQVSTMPTPIISGFSTKQPIAELDTLTQLYNAGQWTELQDCAWRLLNEIREEFLQTNTKPSDVQVSQSGCGKSPETAGSSPNSFESDNLKAAGALLNLRSNYILLTWIGEDPQGKSILPRVVVHDPAGEPFVTDLPGIGVDVNGPTIVEVFLARGVRGKIVSVYTSSREKDPLQEQLPAFIQAIANPLFAAFGTFAGAVRTTRAGETPPLSRARQPKPTIGATISRVGLPHRRASIKWKSVAKEPVAFDPFVDAAVALGELLRYSVVPNERCARELIDALVGKRATDPIQSTVAKTAADAACGDKDGSPAACMMKFDDMFRATFDNVHTSGSEACKALTKEQEAAVALVDKRLRDFVADNLSHSAEAEITFKNRPLTHWSFGGGTGVLAPARLSKPRVKLDDGLIIGDPLPRVVTTTFVNWSPAGYDAELPSPRWAERLRILFGVTITPDFGLTGGGNFLLARGIGVTLTGVLMFAKGAEADAIGHAPANTDRPYAVAYAGGLMLGISYNFK